MSRLPDGLTERSREFECRLIAQPARAARMIGGPGSDAGSISFRLSDVECRTWNVESNDGHGLKFVVILAYYSF